MTVAGGDDESVVQAEWESPGDLLYVSDASGWWNLARISVCAEGAVGSPQWLCPREEEFGGPLWQVGMCWFVPVGAGRVAAIHGRASTTLSLLDTATGTLEPVDLGLDHATEWAATLAAGAAGDRELVVGVVGTSREPYRVVGVDLPARRISSLAVRRGASRPPADVVPAPQARTFAAPGGREVHAIVWSPRGGHPAPYIVSVHGGPTNRAPMVCDLEIAFFTSRGLGVVDVNYGGSTGHGREYRRRLRHSWGIVDVDDCAAVAHALVDAGEADPAQLAIRGGSAGGWTAAAALTFTDVFACGVIQYPILDLAGWRTGETHDFESQYLESLVGPWPAAERQYRDRSPASYPERIGVPFLLMQGLEDEICPPAQAERFLASVAGRGVAHAYLAFEGEQHGFRRESTIVTALEAELALYAQVFGVTPDVDLPPLAFRT